MIPARSAVVAFFALYFAAGMFLVPGYGNGWDEFDNQGFAGRSWGRAADFLSGREPRDPELGDEHGTAFELPILLLENYFGIRYATREPAGHLFRHRLTFLFCFLGAVACYFLAAAFFGGPWPGLAAAALYVLHPRLFAHSMYNSYDPVFLACSTIAFLTLFKLLERRTFHRALLHAAATAYATDVRIVGILLAAITVMCLGLDAARGGSRESYRRNAMLCAVYLIAFASFTVMFWPLLWGAPVEHFRWAFQSMGRIGWDGTVRYLGVNFTGKTLPWHYTPVWIAVSTPPVVLALFLLGLGAAVRKFRDPRVPALAVWLFAPLVAPIVFHSVLFNSWRHHYFVYLAILMFAVMGLESTMALVRAKFPGRERAVAAALAVIFLWQSLVPIVRLHPYQDLYFNFLAEPKNFELDYWGLSYREGLAVLARQNQGRFRLYLTSEPLESNMAWLDPKDRARITFVTSIELADYLITTAPPARSELGHEIYSRRLGDARVLTVRQLR